jgi:hypothetical protein
VKAFSYRRVENHERDARDLADLLRLDGYPKPGSPHWPLGSLRELVRHRAKLVHVRSGLRCQVRAVLAGQGAAGAGQQLCSAWAV